MIPRIRSIRDDVLEAYALDALEDLEALQIESHLEGCERCRLEVARLHNAVSFLGQSVAQRQPSPALLLRLRRALGPPCHSRAGTGRSVPPGDGSGLPR